MKNSMKNSTGTETLSGVPAMSLQQKQQSLGLHLQVPVLLALRFYIIVGRYANNLGSSPKVLGKTAKGERIDT